MQNLAEHGKEPKEVGKREEQSRSVLNTVKSLRKLENRGTIQNLAECSKGPMEVGKRDEQCKT